MSHGSYDLNLGSKRLILVADIRSRSWPNIGDSYGTLFFSLLSGFFLDVTKLEGMKLEFLF